MRRSLPFVLFALALATALWLSNQPDRGHSAAARGNTERAAGSAADVAAPPPAAVVPGSSSSVWPPPSNVVLPRRAPVATPPQVDPEPGAPVDTLASRLASLGSQRTPTEETDDLVEPATLEVAGGHESDFLGAVVPEAAASPESERDAPEAHRSPPPLPVFAVAPAGAATPTPTQPVAPPATDPQPGPQPIEVGSMNGSGGVNGMPMSGPGSSPRCREIRARLAAASQMASMGTMGREPELTMQDVLDCL